VLADEAAENNFYGSKFVLPVSLSCIQSAAPFEVMNILINSGLILQ